MLAARGLAIARAGRTLVRGIDAAFAPGSFTALMGANGAGKSTLLATLCGLLPPAAGRVELDGSDVAALDPRSRAQRIALVEPSESALTSMTVADAVATARFPYHRWWEWQPSGADRRAVEDALGATGLAALRERELRTLSAGERQRVWIALALAQQATIIELDEPTTHLDLRYAIETLALLRRLADGGATVIAVLHLLEEAASFADRILLLGAGRVLADGSPEQALTPSNVAAAYGVDIGVDVRDGQLAFHRKTERPAV